MEAARGKQESYEVRLQLDPARSSQKLRHADVHEPRWETLDLFYIGLLVIYTGVLLLIATGGFADADDQFYLQATDAWLGAPPFVGTLHWHMRHPLLLALAVAFQVFGRTEFAMMVPGAASLFGIVILVHSLVRSTVTRPTAALAALLVASAPVFSIWAKIAYPDVPEVFLSLLSFSLFLRCLSAKRSLAGRRTLLFLAGFVLGTCWIMRASCASLALLYGILMLSGWRINRSAYLWLWAGFAIPLGTEIAYFTIMTGDPLYRFKVDSRSLEIPSAHMIGKVADGLRPPFSWRLMARWLPNSHPFQGGCAFPHFG